MVRFAARYVEGFESVSRPAAELRRTWETDLTPLVARVASTHYRRGTVLELEHMSTRESHRRRFWLVGLLIAITVVVVAIAIALAECNLAHRFARETTAITQQLGSSKRCRCSISPGMAGARSP